MNTEICMFEGITLHVIPDLEHGWKLTTMEVAMGFGVTPGAVRKHKHDHADELSEGKHFTCVTICNAGGPPTKLTLWTKRGVARLGMFITSERAKRFRDWAEDLIVAEMDGQDGPSFLASFSGSFLDHLPSLVALIGMTNARPPKSAYAVEALRRLGIEPGTAAPLAEAGTLAAYILDNAGTAFPNHSSNPDLIAVRWSEVEQAARDMGVAVPPSPLSALRNHPWVKRVNWPVYSDIAGKQVKCVVLRRPSGG